MFSLKLISQRHGVASILSNRYGEILVLVNCISMLEENNHCFSPLKDSMWIAKKNKYLDKEWFERMVEHSPHTVGAAAMNGNNDGKQMSVLGLHIFLKRPTSTRFWSRFSATCNCISCIGMENETKFIFYKPLNYWEETRSCQSIIILLESRGQIFETTSSVWGTISMINEKHYCFILYFAKFHIRALEFQRTLTIIIINIFGYKMGLLNHSYLYNKSRKY